MSATRNLLRFTVRGEGLCEIDGLLGEYNLFTAETFLVDGNSFALRAFESVKRDRREKNPQEELDECEQFVRQFFERFSEYKITILFATENVQDQPETSGDEAEPEPLSPSVAAKTIRAVATELSVAIEDHTGPIYDRANFLSRKFKCPILTDDGYFLPKEPEFGLILWDTIGEDVGDCKLFVLGHPNYKASCRGVDRDVIELLNLCFRRRLTDEAAIYSGSGWSGVVQDSNVKAGQLVGRTNRERQLASFWAEYGMTSGSYNISDEVGYYFNKVPWENRHFDLRFDRTSRELQKAIEDVCDCPEHYRFRVSSWPEFLHLQKEKWANNSSTLFKQLQSQLDKSGKNDTNNPQLTEADRRDILLGGFHFTSEKINQHLELYQANGEGEIVREFFTVKMLMFAIGIERPDLESPPNFKQATLSSLIYYLGKSGRFLTTYRSRLVNEIIRRKHKLRAPMRGVITCDRRTIKCLKKLIEVITLFNKMNAQLDCPMQPVRPEKWLNPCLIYNLTADPQKMGDQIPEELSSSFDLT